MQGVAGKSRNTGGVRIGPHAVGSGSDDAIGTLRIGAARFLMTNHFSTALSSTRTGLLSLSVTVAVVAACAGASGGSTGSPGGATQAPGPSSPKQSGACPVTIANGSVPPGETMVPNAHGNGYLWTALWPEGKVVASPNPDGSISMKFPWWRGAGVQGELTISGRRLDKPAAPLRADIPPGYGMTGFQSSGLTFPTVGCWEITGRAERRAPSG